MKYEPGFIIHNSQVRHLKRHLDEISNERWEEADCLFDVPEGLTVGEDIICGSVTVPEQHANPDGQTIRLAVAILKSDGDAPAPDPLVMFTGGPGGNIFAMAPAMLSEFGAPIRADRDIVLMSERGTYGAVPSWIAPNSPLWMNTLARHLRNSTRSN